MAIEREQEPQTYQQSGVALFAFLAVNIISYILLAVLMGAYVYLKKSTSCLFFHFFVNMILSLLSLVLMIAAAYNKGTRNEEEITCFMVASLVSLV